MRKIHIFIAIAVMAFNSCEKIWEADLKERAYDTIRGQYEIVSAVWEGPEPVDIDGDGVASYSYLDEWERVTSGIGACKAFIHNESGSLEIPYTIDDRDEWEISNGEPPQLTRRRYDFGFNIKAVIDGKDESHLEFEFEEPEGSFYFEHSGYGEIIFRKNVTFTVRVNGRDVKEMSGPVLFKYVRDYYTGE